MLALETLLSQMQHTSSNIQSVMPFPLPVTPVIVIMLIPVSVFPAALLIPVLLPILDSVPLPVPLLVLIFLAFLSVLLFAMLLDAPIPPGLLATIIL